MALRHENLTSKILGCIYEVHNEVGVGLDEETYHQALLKNFSRNGVPAVSKERKALLHRGVPLRSFELDVMAYDKIILALKSVQSNFLQNHYVQIISELKLWQKDLGMLVNFGKPKAEIERIPFDEKKKKFVEDYSEIKDKITSADRQLLAKVRSAILFVFETHGLGYGKIVYQNLLRAELDYRGLSHDRNYAIPVVYQGEAIRLCKVKALRIADRLLCGVTAIQNQITLFDAARLRTYLRYSNLPLGLLVNFAKSNLEIRALTGS
ncbi:MAG: GxxExxY protein [candidate division KSB1 bacterium]